MTTVTGLTADRMIAIEAASIVDGDVVDGDLILTRHDGTQINAGPVVGPEGPPGPIGSFLSVLSAKHISDVGLANQIRAGRQLGPEDFGNMGLSPPIGLWNLSGLSDASGNGRNLLNKGSVLFDGIGINGLPNTAARFIGSTAQALYISDTGANDPFRIKTGSVGAWFRSAKRGAGQEIVAKRGAAGGTFGYQLVFSSNKLAANISLVGTDFPLVLSTTDICDDCWHFGVFTYDGTSLRLYVDGIQEGMITYNPGGPIFGSSQPLNIGSFGADGAVAAAEPMFGRVDEVFITADVLNEDQVRNLYCTKIAHSLGVIPTRATINVRRRRRGAALVVADFPTPPLRLYNFSAGSLADQGSQNVTLQNNNGAVSVAGVDGTVGNAFSFKRTSVQTLSSSDAGLPAGTNPRSYGCWFKNSTPADGDALISWGGGITSQNHALYVSSNNLIARSCPTGATIDDIAGPFASDGLWHFAVVTEENAPADGIKRKLYVDGKLVGISTVLHGIVLGGANRFRIGGWPDGTALLLNGQVDCAFVCDYILTAEQILGLYAKSSQTLAISPKNAGDHIEALTPTDLLAVFDNLDSQHQVDVGVAA